MAKDYKNPLEARVTKPEKPVVIDGISKELHARLSAEWEKMSIGEDEYLNPLDEYTPPEWALSKDDINFASFGDVHFLTGQSGTGKTFTFVGLMGAIMKGSFGPIKYVCNTRPNPKVLYIDTEQSKGSTQLVMRRVYHMAGWAQGSDHRDQFNVLMLRETTKPSDRWAKCIRAMYDLRPDFVFIDGALDIVDDMNKSDLCSQLIGECLACSSIFKLCMFLVLHENPLSLESALKGLGKMAGHVGSFLLRKAAAGMGTVKKLEGTDATMIVLQKKARNKDFGDYSYKIHDVDMCINGERYDLAVPYPIVQDISITGKKKIGTIVTIENVKEYMQTIMDKVQWPATQDQIKDALVTYCMITNHDTQSEILTKAKNRNWLKLDHKEANLAYWNIDVDPF